MLLWMPCTLFNKHGCPSQTESSHELWLGEQTPLQESAGPAGNGPVCNAAVRGCTNHQGDAGIFPQSRPSHLWSVRHERVYRWDSPCAWYWIVFLFISVFYHLWSVWHEWVYEWNSHAHNTVFALFLSSAICEVYSMSECYRWDNPHMRYWTVFLYWSVFLSRAPLVFLYWCVFLSRAPLAFL